MGAVLAALWAVAAVFVALGASLKVLAWAIGPPAVKAAAMQLGLLVIVLWFASTILAACCGWRLARRVGA